MVTESDIIFSVVAFVQYFPKQLLIKRQIEEDMKMRPG